jgi:hypothetical protein
MKRRNMGWTRRPWNWSVTPNPAPRKIHVKKCSNNMSPIWGMSHFAGTNGRLRYNYRQRSLSSWFFVGFLQTLSGLDQHLPYSSCTVRTLPISWNCPNQRRIALSEGGSFPEFCNDAVFITDSFDEPKCSHCSLDVTSHFLPDISAASTVLPIRLLKLRFHFQSVAWLCSRGCLVVKALCYKPEGCGFDTRLGTFLKFYLILPAALGPGVYWASNRNEYQKHKNNNVCGE